MILSDAYQQIGRRTSLSTDDAIALSRMRDAISSSIKEMARRCKFLALRESAEIKTVEDTEEYILDDRALYFKEFKHSDGGPTLEVWNPSKFNKLMSGASVANNKPRMIVPMKQVWCKAQPGEASVIAFESTSASDNGSKCFTRGISGGLEITETVELGQQGGSSTKNEYTEVLQISKKLTVGTVVATAGDIEIARLGPSDKYKKYWLARLYPTPDQEYTIEYSFFRIPWINSEEEDILPIDDRFDDALVDMSCAYVLKTQGDQKWVNDFASATKKIDEIMSNDYFAEDEDARMGLIEYDQEYSDW